MRAVVARRRAATAILVTGLIVTGLVLAACATAQPLKQPSWPAPPAPMALTTQAGLEATQSEHLNTHTHAHLHVFVDGNDVVVPSGIGIDIDAPTGIEKKPTLDGTATEYYVRLCFAPCLSPLHTHDPSGVIHTESKQDNQEPYSLGQFFTEWGVRLDDSCVGEFCKSDTSIAIYLNGKKYDGNPAEIKLKSHLEIAIVIGKPPALIPDSWDFGPLP
jgi:hypothetical protein